VVRVIGICHEGRMNKDETKMLSELNRFKTNKFEEYLNSDIANNKDIIDILDATLTRPEIIQIRPGKKRSDRDAFITKLCSLTFENMIVDFIRSKENLINVSENIFDRISSFIEKCEVSERPEDIQIWSHIKRVESAFKEMSLNIDKHLNIKPKNKVLSPYPIVKNNEGVEFSPDAVSDHYIKYLSITINLLAYKYNWFRDEKIIIPIEIDVSEEDIFRAESIELLARSWKEAEISTQRSILFGGDVQCHVGLDVQDDARKSGVKVSYHFEREESEYEVYDSISCERIRKKSLQNILSILSNEKLRKGIVSDIESVGSLTDCSFLSEDEILACTILDDIFCTNILIDDNEYHGLKISEWIRSYSVIKYISQSVNSGHTSSIFAKTEILQFLLKAGISACKSNIFIDLITFSRSSNDLYDCPLLKLTDDRFYLAYYSCIHINISTVILSRFSSLETNASVKGYRFERETINLISDEIGDCKSFKFKRGLNEYEYDAVFLLDNRLFVLECKNRSLSWYNPVKAFRNKKYLNDTANQVIRLKNALIEYPEVIREHFDVDVSNYEVVPIIFNCMPFSWAGKFKNVYVSDFSSFSRLLKNSEIHLVKSSKKGQKIEKTSLFKQWKGQVICSDDIIRHMENPVQLTPYIKSRKPDSKWWVADDEVAFTVVNYEIDIPEYEKQERKLLSSVASKPKRTVSNCRKNMVKNSRRRNRKK
jgi:hypothetical protein